ncbi:MAG: MBL fold metallo-hydrolase [Clostridiales bacterium]|nr:MBL fold metallo-hydrolase [Clostridiales bacterium]
MAKETKSGKKIWAARVVLAAVLIAALLVSLLWTDAINRKFGLIQTEEKPYDGEYTAQEVLELGGDLNVHFVDVGQGDACIIEFPDERTMLIDAGDTHTKNKQNLLDYIEKNINDAEGNDITYFDFAVLTHPDSDHCGGMYDVLTKYPAKTFYRPSVYSSYTKNGFTDPDTSIDRTNKNNVKDTAAYGKAIEAGYNADKINGVESEVIVTNFLSDGDDAVITPEGVAEGEANYYEFTFFVSDTSYTDWNDYSPVMVLEYQGKRFMLSGDAEKKAEENFVARAKEGKGNYAMFTEDFTVDVFKLGHHGSRTSSSEAFIEAMTTAENRPNVKAIISCGEGNKYKHPHTEVLERLTKMGFADENIVRTDVNGSIAMSVRGEVAASGGGYTYELFMGAEAVRRTAAAVGNDTVQLTWKEIVIAAIVLIVIVLIVLPVVRNLQKQARAAAKQSSSQSRGGTRGKGSARK